MKFNKVFMHSVASYALGALAFWILLDDAYRKSLREIIGSMIAVMVLCVLQAIAFAKNNSQSP